MPRAELLAALANQESRHACHGWSDGVLIGAIVRDDNDTDAYAELCRRYVASVAATARMFLVGTQGSLGGLELA